MFDWLTALLDCLSVTCPTGRLVYFYCLLVCFTFFGLRCHYFSELAVALLVTSYFWYTCMSIYVCLGPLSLSLAPLPLPLSLALFLSPTPPSLSLSIYLSISHPTLSLSLSLCFPPSLPFFLPPSVSLFNFLLVCSLCLFVLLCFYCFFLTFLFLLNS